MVQVFFGERAKRVGCCQVEPCKSEVGSNTYTSLTSHVLCKHSNGERASLANLKLTIGSLLACS